MDGNELLALVPFVLVALGPELVTNEWIHLFQIDPAEGAAYARRDGAWKLAPA